MSSTPSPLSSRRLRLLPIAAALLATVAAVATLTIEPGNESAAAPFTVPTLQLPFSDALTGLGHRG